MIGVRGYGTVCPAGWGVAPFREALAAGTPIPTRELQRPALADPCSSAPHRPRQLGLSLWPTRACGAPAPFRNMPSLRLSKQSGRSYPRSEAALCDWASSFASCAAV